MGAESLLSSGLGNTVGMAASLGADAFKTVYGLWQILHGQKGLKNLQHPDYTADPNVLYNQKLAQSYAGQGFGNQYLNMAADNASRNLGTSINSFEKTGQGLNTISNSATSSNNAFQDFLIQDAMQKSRNRDTLYSANKDVRDENLRSFDWNKAIPYQQKFNMFTNQTNSPNFFEGLKGIGSDFIGMGGNKQSGGGGGDQNQILQNLIQYLSTKGLNNAGNTANANANNEMNWSF